MGLMKRNVNWVLDADIRGCFDAIDHGWLIKFIEHLIADKQVVRHVKKWLNAGVMEEEKLRQSSEGTPQGGSISPLLCNIYLHYVFDLWIDRWRHKEARGHVIVVRYADELWASNMKAKLGDVWKHCASDWHASTSSCTPRRPG